LDRRTVESSQPPIAIGRVVKQNLVADSTSEVAHPKQAVAGHEVPKPVAAILVVSTRVTEAYSAKLPFITVFSAQRQFRPGLDGPYSQGRHPHVGQCRAGQ
jgi:hypothetical protein